MSFPPGQQGPSIDPAIIHTVPAHLSSSQPAFYEISCYAAYNSGQPVPNGGFLVSVSRSMVLSQLRKAIVEEMAGYFSQEFCFRPVDLKLWTVEKFMGHYNFSDPPTALQSLSDEMNQTPLYELVSSGLHLVVQIPTELPPSSDLIPTATDLADSRLHEYESIRFILYEHADITQSKEFSSAHANGYKVQLLTTAPTSGWDEFNQFNYLVPPFTSKHSDESIAENLSFKTLSPHIKDDNEFPFRPSVYRLYLHVAEDLPDSLEREKKNLEQLFNNYFFVQVKAIVNQAYNNRLIPLINEQLFWCRILAYRQHTGQHLGYNPIPDFAILDQNTKIPLLVAETKSQPNGGDCFRMLIYSAFYVRLLFLLWEKSKQEERQPSGVTFKFSISTWYFEPHKVTQRDVGLKDPIKDPGDNKSLIPIEFQERFFYLSSLRDRVNLVTRFCQSIQNIAHNTNLEWLSGLKEYKAFNDTADTLTSLTSTTAARNTAGKTGKNTAEKTKKTVEKTEKNTATSASKNARKKRKRDDDDGADDDAGHDADDGADDDDDDNSHPNQGPSGPGPGQGRQDQGSGQGGQGQKPPEQGGPSRSGEASSSSRRGTGTLQSSFGAVPRWGAPLDQIAQWVERHLLKRDERVTNMKTRTPNHLWEATTTSGGYFAKLDVDQESSILKKLKSHPNIIPFLGTVNLPSVGDAFIMPRGLNWSQFFRTFDFKPHVFKSVIGFLSGVKFMHDCGIANRDLKPDNIVFLSVPDPNNPVQIIDFGYATEDELVDDVVGTERFMAPEVLAGEKYDPKLADLYSAGIVVKQFAEVINFWENLSPPNLRELSALLAKEDPSERLSLSSFFEFYDQRLGGEISESKIDGIIRSFIAQERSWSRRPLPPGSDVSKPYHDIRYDIHKPYQDYDSAIHRHPSSTTNVCGSGVDKTNICNVCV